MTPTSHPRRSLKFLLAALAAASLVACSSAGGEQKAETKSSPGSASGGQATTTTDSPSDATDTGSSGTTTTEAGAEPGAEPEVLGSSTGQHPGGPNDSTSVPLRLDVVAVERQPGEAVEVRFTLTNESDDASYKPYRTLAESGLRGIDNYDVGGAALVDLPGDKRYLALRDAGEGAANKCLCTDGLSEAEIAPGTTLDAYVQFPAPPEKVTKVDFTMPGFAPVNGLEIR